MSKNIIVIGSGAAGMTAASEAKRVDPSANVTVITDDEYIAYSPCVIPWAIEGEAKWEDIVMHDADYYAKERDISVLIKGCSECRHKSRLHNYFSVSYFTFFKLLYFFAFS